MDADEAVRIAILMREVDRGGDATAFEHELTRLSRDDLATVHFVGKIMEGKPYQVTSDRAESIAHYRAVALRLGATVREADEDGGLTRLVFSPPARQ